tara:strand:+ start:274 stop:528 length:255 start_codon:yes stop_codon:yes gene_type:complete
VSLLTKFVPFPPEPAYFRAFFFKLQNRMFKRIFSSKGANFADFLHLHPPNNNKNQVLVPPLLVIIMNGPMQVESCNIGQNPTIS